MTTSMVIGLTVFAFTTRVDFTMKRGALFILAFSCSVFCVLVWGFDYYYLNMIYALIFVVVFGLFLIFESQLIVGGKRYALGIDEYIIGALMLYSDIITIFVYLVKALGN